MENKLTIKELAPYAPYNLKVQLGVTERDLTAISCDSKYVFVTEYIGARKKQMAGIESIKPLLRPLSDLTNEIEHNGEKFVFSDLYFTNNKIIKAQNPNNCLFNNMLNDLDYNSIQLLLRYHFDVFGLIERGLALPIKKMKS